MSSTVNQTSTTPPSTVAATAAATAAQQADSAAQQLTADKTQFLTLLTAQLQNQDPLSPMDSATFTNQLVQYSAVEQQININQNLATLISLTQQNLLSGATSYVGKAIEATGSQAPLQSSQLNVGYSLSANSANTTIAVTDSSGNVVYSTSGSTDAGAHTFNWNGQTSGGQQEPDGAYTVTITALGSNNAPVNVAETVYGTVTSATLDPTTNETMLNMGAVSVPLSSVTSVG